MPKDIAGKKIKAGDFVVYACSAYSSTPTMRFAKIISFIPKSKNETARIVSVDSGYKSHSTIRLWERVLKVSKKDLSPSARRILGPIKTEPPRAIKYKVGSWSNPQTAYGS